MTFEQWQQKNEHALESYGNHDALCRSAYDAGRATRDGQFESNIAMNNEVIRMNEIINDKQFEVNNLVQLVKDIETGLTATFPPSQVAIIKDVLKLFKRQQS